MTVETKYYCDECGREVTDRAISIAVMVTSGYYEMPDRFNMEVFRQVPYKFKQVYNKFICHDCVGEAVQEYRDGEGGRSFELKEAARSFLINHGLLKPKQS